MYTTDDLEQESVPKHMQGVYDPTLKISYWVFSDFELDFEKARLAVAKFMGARSRYFEQDYEKIFSLPPEVILVVQKDGRVLSRGLPTPEQLVRKQALVRKRKEKLISRFQPPK